MTQVPVAADATTGTAQDDGTRAVLGDLASLRIVLVNVAFIGPPVAGDRGWVLIDAGVGPCAGTIARAAEARFGAGARPAAIVMTHGHADHVGALARLAERYDAPVFAHPLEHPYLDGSTSYPPPDPGVGGGLMSVLSPLFPRDPVDVSRWLRPLPDDGSIPVLPNWRWVHTPGHSPGHVSFWRAADQTLLSGDAFITTGQESAYAVATQRPELHGPPMYYTTDWEAARESVRTLAALDPETIVSGHGPPMHGPAMRAALRRLAEDFDRVAVPAHGRYVRD